MPISSRLSPLDIARINRALSTVYEGEQAYGVCVFGETATANEYQLPAGQIAAEDVAPLLYAMLETNLILAEDVIDAMNVMRLMAHGYQITVPHFSVGQMLASYFIV